MQLELNLTQARTRAELGIERAADKAERKSPGWIDDAVEALRKFPDEMGWLFDDFTIDEARPFVESSCPRPEGVDGRVWGAITRKAVQAGYIERVPGRFREAASSNGSPKPVYRKGVSA